ncbi:MAG: DUF1624 domain-containing protein [Bacteroidetes bacterium]|nr:DUF1624 domain-containing protein [Bacteroidota bacterium]
MARARIGYIDQFRGLATIFMIETHVVNALLLNGLRESFTFSTLDFLNGLVAPSFLFVAGFSFTLAVNRNGDAYRKFSPELVRHLRRLLFIMAVGYMMHIPYFSLFKTVHGSTSQDITAFFAVDILQCIAVTLILLHLLRVLIKSDRTFNIVVWGLFWFFIVAAPIVGLFDTSKVLPQFLGQYLNRLNGSLFPLFPWSSFLIAGAIASQKITFEKEGRFADRLILTGGALIVVGYLLYFIHRTFFPQPDLFNYAPGWFILRLGILLWILKGVIWYESKRKLEWSAVKTFGRESFLVYVAHILFVYGSSAKNVSLVDTIGRSLNYLQCFWIFAGLTAAMFVVAYVWSILKKRDYNLSRLVQYAFISGILWMFIRNPY